MVSRSRGVGARARLTRAVVVPVGRELLEGVIRDSNAYFLAGRLSHLGFQVSAVLCVGDSVADVTWALESARGFFGAGLAVLTGGLGATRDDVTRDAVARFLGVGLEEHPVALRWVREKTEARGLPLTPERRRMALLPAGSEPLRNSAGVAPGIIVEAGGMLVVALPGVPEEARAVWLEEAEPRLRGLASSRMAEARLVLEGVYEADIVHALEEASRHAYVKSLAKKPGGNGAPVVEVYVQGRGSSAEEAEDKCRRACETLRRLLGRFVSGGSCECGPLP